MNEKHYKEKLSGFVNHELSADERQALAGHLLTCAECRAEHDEIKLGAALAGCGLKQTDAPENLWHRIESSLDEKPAKTVLFPNFAFFNARGLTVAALLLIGALAAAIYFGFRQSDAPEIARGETPAQNPKTETAPVASPPGETIADQTPTQTPETLVPAPILPPVNSKVPSAAQSAGLPESKITPSRENPPAPVKGATPVKTALAAWNVETLSGMPRIGDSFKSGKLAVGETLETDANSRARVEVANIGDVEIAPNSRVKLVNTRSTEHRLSLEKGMLKATILAPPRLFIVDTPSAAAVDLGCEYTLEVDADGNARLHVTSGFVALENGRFESIVPAGAIALTKKGKGVGTPFAEDASAKLQKALFEFDFENGGAAALETILSEAGLNDSISLWHLLARVREAERGKVFDALAALVKPPAKVSRAGILRLDRRMLDAWWTEIENVWFE